MGSNGLALRLLGMLVFGLLLAVQPGLAAGQEVPLPEAPGCEKDAEEAVPEAVEEEEPYKLIKMFAEEWKWSPNEIRVPVGTKLRIEFLSYGATRKFELKAYNLKVLTPQDKLVSVEFVADKKGTFRWRCGRPCGNGCAKMTGKLIVE
jgi:heme/copper-type cytochrome/quinol oxidase subunit 2